MPEVLLVNPRKRRRRAKKARAAAPRRRRRSASKRRTFRRNPIGFAGNPRRRRSRRRSFRRNPVGILGDLQSSILPVGIGAAGAIATDLAMNMLPVPAMLKTGMLRPVTKTAAAVALGIVAGMVTSKATGRKVMAGALTVVAYDSLKGMLQKAMPALPLGNVEEYPLLEYTDTGSGDSMGALFVDDEGMGQLVDESDPGMGELVDESDPAMGALFVEGETY